MSLTSVISNMLYTCSQFVVPGIFIGDFLVHNIRDSNFPRVPYDQDGSRREAINNLFITWVGLGTDSPFLIVIVFASSEICFKVKNS